MGREVFYITTPIYYPNDVPHIGHAYNAVAVDVVARYRRLRGEEVFHLTGTDEHGLKLQRAAEAAGMHPQRWVDEMEPRWREVWARLDIAYDDYIRTTEPRHEAAVAKLLEAVYGNGRDDIYLGTYEGLYCVSCEAYYTEDELRDGLCPIHERRVERLEEENYFFRLSAYRDRLLDHYAENPSAVEPESRRNEVLAAIRGGLRDFSISRTTFDWGIPLPWDPKHVCYVWFDALTNYITAAGYADDPVRFARTWPADVHVIGKDILKPHAVFWPTMLKSAGLPLYKRLVVHGHILAMDGRKMGKSLGNAIDPVVLLDKFGVDAVHYALLRDTSLGSDSPFGEEIVVQRLNADLANDLGNLLSRVRTMLLKYCGGVLPAPSPADSEIARHGVALAGKVRVYVDELKLHLALEEALQYVRSLNKFVNDAKPWELARDPARLKELEDVLYTVVEGLRIASVALEAALPTKAKELRAALGLGGFTLAQTETWGLSPQGTRIPQEAPILFPKLEAKPAPTPEAEALEPQAPNGLITLEDFAKIELRVAEVVKCEKHPKADKLLVLTLNVGDHTRQVVSGIAQWYAPQSLVGRKLVLVANLKPAVLRGIESQGMILAGEDAAGNVVVVSPEKDLPPGAKVR
ncbi:MAG: methionine--tRNA ligase [Thermaceae bacterium]|nr:methionine--tRNA ligase [Thermaceae bacterium]